MVRALHSNCNRIDRTRGASTRYLPRSEFERCVAKQRVSNSEVGPTLASKNVVAAVRGCVTGVDGFEHVPDDVRTPQSGFGVDTRGERSARSGRLSPPREEEITGPDRLAFLTESSRRLA